MQKQQGHTFCKKYISELGSPLRTDEQSCTYVGHQIENKNNKVAIKLYYRCKYDVTRFQRIVQQLNLAFDKQEQGVVKFLGFEHNIDIKVIGSSFDFAIVTQLIGETLQDLINNNILSQQQSTDIIFQVANCYRSFYDSNILFRRIKPEMILIKRNEKQMTVKLDFSRFFEQIQTEGKLDINFVGQKNYSSPQVQRSLKYTSKADVYSLGSTFYTLITKNKLIKHVQFDETMRSVNIKQVRHQLITRKISQNVVQFIVGCLEYQENDRLSWQDIYKHLIFFKHRNHFTVRPILSKNQQGQQQIKKSIMLYKNKQRPILKPQQVFNRLDQLFQENYQQGLALVDLIINEPLTQQEIQQNKNMTEQLQQRIKQEQANKQQQYGSIDDVLLQLKTQLQSSGIQVILSKQSNVKSQIGIKMLSTGFLNSQTKFSQVLQKQDCKWNFDDLKKSDQQYQNFEKWYKQKIFQETGIQKESIVIHKVTHCCVKVQWSAPDGTVSQTKVPNSKLKLHPFMNRFTLCLEDFDPAGNIKFQNYKKGPQKRGNWPYYPPFMCKRYGLKVTGRYDGGNDTWLGMKNGKGQWAVAFHGVNYPGNTASDKGITVMNSIMQGIKQGEMLIAGGAQHHKGDNAVNYPNQKVDVGIYCSPHFEESLDYTNVVPINKEGNKNYRLIFQCRVKPQKIKITPRQEYWVINESKNIRPYGIILVYDGNVKQIKNIYSKFQKFGQQSRVLQNNSQVLQTPVQTPVPQKSGGCQVY